MYKSILLTKSEIDLLNNVIHSYISHNTNSVSDSNKQNLHLIIRHINTVQDRNYSNKGYGNSKSNRFISLMDK